MLRQLCRFASGIWRLRSDDPIIHPPAVRGSSVRALMMTLSQDRLLDDKFNETDMRMIADNMVADLVGSAVVAQAPKPPVVLITFGEEPHRRAHRHEEHDRQDPHRGYQERQVQVYR